ncbi:MAG TPA: 4-(cytidine 5'-diphospho)-2-C-methyl-D-erythritol kinase [Candidatus Limnocylindria bacterium]|nr:4-(cytidine 5'-diphospho)-2-C-methyl-D-erythritol kinase [Candidatus Limnocylindria bacterium]
MSRTARLAAPAKVNLTLEVIGERADGYHELRSVFATLELADRVRVSASGALDVAVRPDPGAAPGTELAARAVAALAAAAGRPAKAHVRVAKRIPVAAGLGGGSSDAGAVLRGLARVWRTEVDIGTVGAAVGSDVPFFASGAAFALVEGRGERVRALPAPPEPLWIVLVRVRARVATADVFRALRAEEWGDGRRSSALAAAFADGSVDPATIRSHSGNDLLAAASRVCRDIGEARLLAGSKGVTLLLSGSGPSLFAVADSRRDALRLARILRGQGLDARPQELGPRVARAIRASALLLPSTHGRHGPPG